MENKEHLCGNKVSKFCFRNLFPSKILFPGLWKQKKQKKQSKNRFVSCLNSIKSKVETVSETKETKTPI